MSKKTKYIFVVGGVMSGVGKGVASSSIAKILQARGFEVTAVKIDPYVNVDAGTMNPTEHGEVFVLDDGTECDQDMGNYERFLNRDLSKTNYMTTGSVYLSVIERERNLAYGGKCVEVVPHIPLEVISRLERAAQKNDAEIVVVEIGGTVGQYDNVIYLEAIRMLKFKNPGDILLALVSHVPALGAGGNELKTKPTQHAVRSLNSVGLHPDLVFGRAHIPLDARRKEKLEFMCSLNRGDVISAPNVESIYDIPLNFEREELSQRILKKLSLRPRKQDLKEWKNLVGRIHRSKGELKIGIVGKYFGTGDFVLEDSYISVIEAVKHAAAKVHKKPIITWINSEEFETQKGNLRKLRTFNGIIVPGGFGGRGVEGKISVIRFCRKNKIPYFGLCYGMQLAVVEYAREVAGLRDAHTTEVKSDTTHPVIDIMPGQKKNLAEKNFGATMRLGAYPAELLKNTHAAHAYRSQKISERHRHRYEVNPEYVDRLTGKGLVFSGKSPDGTLMEIMELPRKIHPFFLGTQFHPELKSRPLSPHPLFVAFLRAASTRRIP
ncbi:MAG: CTP synthase [Patescibacteria group bacterium]